MGANCRICESANVSLLNAETNLHFPGRRGLDQQSIFAFPRVMVCLNCGYAEFTLAESELRLLRTEATRPSGEKTAAA